LCRRASKREAARETPSRAPAFLQKGVSMIPDGLFTPFRSQRKRAAAFALLLLAAGSVLAAAGCSGRSTRIGRNRDPEATLTVTGSAPVALGAGEMPPADDAVPLVQAPTGASIVVTCRAHDKDGDPLT